MEFFHCLMFVIFTEFCVVSIVFTWLCVFYDVLWKIMHEGHHHWLICTRVLEAEICDEGSVYTVIKFVIEFIWLFIHNKVLTMILFCCDGINIMLHAL